MTAMNMDEQTHLLDIGVVQVDVLRVDRCERLNVLLVADVQILLRVLVATDVVHLCDHSKHTHKLSYRRRRSSLSSAPVMNTSLSSSSSIPMKLVIATNEFLQPLLPNGKVLFGENTYNPDLRMVPGSQSFWIDLYS